jgi:hypothetical protein
MSLRLAAPARQPFHPAWMAVPLLLFVIAFGAFVFASGQDAAPLQAGLPAVVAELPPAA